MEEQQRLLQEWGGFEPDTQKALRFVALSDVGAAKQIAGAISREYASRKPESVQETPKNSTHPRSILSEDELQVLRLAENGMQTGGIELATAVHLSGLEEGAFYRCIDSLRNQGYLGGDALTGFWRTKKRIPKARKALTEDEVKQYVALFQKRHPEIDNEQADFMRRAYLMMQKVNPGWTL